MASVRGAKFKQGNGQRSLQQARRARRPTHPNGNGSTPRAAIDETFAAEKDSFEAVFGNAPTGAYRVSPDGKFAVVNRALVEMLGYDTPEDFFAVPLNRLHSFPAYSWDDFRRRLEQEGQIRGIESIWTRKDGSPLLTRENCWILRGHRGQRRMVEASVFNLASQRALETVRAFPAAFDTLAVGLVQIDLQGRFLQSNRAFQELVGYGEAELANSSYPNLSLPDHHEADEARLKSLLAGEAFVFKTEKRLARKDRDTVWIQETASLVRDIRNNPRFVNIIVEDITDRKVAEQRLVRRTTELEAANRELESFAYTVSHDLRAPLRAIEGFSSLLVEEHGKRLKPEAKRILGRIRSATERMGHLIENLLELSKVTRYRLMRERIDLSPIATTTFRQLRSRERHRRGQLVVKPSIPAHGDPRLLQVVLQNLIDNAWKFTRTRPDPRITVGSQRLSGRRTYFVRDNGVGFDMALAGKLFQPFQRLHRPDEFEGNGIGLATVQRVVQRHGGRVWVKSRPNRGTTVFFTLSEHGEGSA